MRILFTLCVCMVLGTLQAQKLDHRLGYIILQVEDDKQLDDLVGDYASKFRSNVQVEKALSQRLGIYLMRFDHARIHEGMFLHELRHDSRVKIAQYDHITTNRNIPDDPQFIDQWHWFNSGQTGGLINADSDVELAWDITQGGVTALGDTIVVAIIDDGLNYLHPDIAANTWINHGEIPGNGIDDDENGYKDDVYGWNVYSDSSDVLNQGHGLGVAGMIGAVGNNGIGISGINWNVKMMTIVGGTPESSAIASYAYALEQRILYHESNGEKGAFVVSTNSSWGIDYGQPADAPLWCAFYDSLGVHGILSAAATANNPDDIDIVGDLPTACTSPYLLSVTALNHSDQRTFSAFGLEHVDFGAPGENVFTTRGSMSYGNTSGTSFASPVAAGLVALLYSAPVLGVAELAHSDPEAAAAFIRDMIFNGVRKIPEMEPVTRFGGALNAWNSMSLLMAVSSDCPIPFGIHHENISEDETIIDWTTIEVPDNLNVRYKPAASVEWDTLFDVQKPLSLVNLLSCTDYILEFESICADTSTGFVSTYEFKTEGCCELPATIEPIANETTIDISWSHVFAAEYFLIQWREVGQPEWLEVVTSLDEITLDFLQPCTLYEFRLQTNCDTTVTGFSEIFQLRTKGCGNCLDLIYCEAGSDDSSEEFIDSLIIGPLTNHSGQNGGYAIFEDLNPLFISGETYPVMLRPGFGTPEQFSEQFRIWLDADQNGEFDEDELIFDSVLVEGDTVLLSELTIPVDAVNGSTRMRVSMAFFEPPFGQEPCGNVDFGEVEDYCVLIDRDVNTCPEVDTLVFDAINFTGAFMYWPSAEGAIAYTYRYRAVGELEFMEMATVDTTASLAGLVKCTMYEVQIRSICIVDTTAYDTTYILETDCDVAVEETDPLLYVFAISPNPFSDQINITLQSEESGDHFISVYNMHGKKVEEVTIYADNSQPVNVTIDQLNKYPPGMYIVMIENKGRIASKKLIKI